MMRRVVLGRWREWRRKRLVRELGDPGQLRRVRQLLGPQIRKPQVIEHYMYVSSEERARAVVSILSSAGFVVALSRVDDLELPLELVASRSALVTANEIAAARSLIEPLVEDYDGWHVPVVD